MTSAYSASDTADRDDPPEKEITLLQASIQSEQDVVTLRQKARALAGEVGLGVQKQTWLTTALSEIARNAVSYAGGGDAEFVMRLRDGQPFLDVHIRDHGPGIPHLSQVLSGNYRSRSGTGKGVLGARRLVDHFHIESAPHVGTTVTLGVAVAATGLPTPDLIRRIRQTMASPGPGSVFEDLTRQNQELIRVQEELAAKNDALQRLSEEKDRFIGMAAHDLRGPITNIVGFCDLLASDTETLSKEQADYLSVIRSASRHMLHLIDDLLDINRLNTGRIDLSLRDNDVGAFLRQVERLVKPSCTLKGIGLAFDVALDTGTVIFDADRLEQVMLNLIGNAVKFSETGTTITVSVRRESRDVLIVVADQGLGIPEGDLPGIFEPFRRSTTRATRNEQGTGLGLAICRSLMRLHGGEISVESTVGVGSRFSLRLPQHPVEVRQA